MTKGEEVGTENRRQPLLMQTTLNQLEWIQKAHGEVGTTLSALGWRAHVPGNPRRCSSSHAELAEAVQELYIALGEP